MPVVMSTSAYFVALVAALAAVAGPAPEVHYRGSLKQIMHEGNLESQIQLSDLQSRPHLFAIGAVSGLKGEIAVIDSKAFVSSVNNGAVVTDSSLSAGAALLVWSQVAHWKQIDIPTAVRTMEKLEEFVALQATSNKIDTSLAFAFRMTGAPHALDWHVIDWPKGDTVHTHEKHEQAGLHGRLRGAEVQIIGFYSQHHQGIFTHMSSSMHLHVVSSDHALSAHVDSLELGGGMKLFLPR